MLCPKCGNPRAESPDCPRCGIVYAKFNAQPAARPPPAPDPAAAPPAPRGRAGAAAAIVAVAIVAAGLAFQRLRPRPPEIGDPVAISTPPASATAPAATATDAPTLCGSFTLSDIPSPPSVSPEWYDGASGFQRAGEEQASSGAPVLVLFHTTWCPYCRRFIAEVIPSAQMQALGTRILKVKVDAEGSGEERELARRFSVRSYPSLMVIAAAGRPPVRLTQWSSPSTFVAACEKAMSAPAREHLDKGISLSRSGTEDEAADELKAAASDPALAPLALDRLGLLALHANCFSPAAEIYGRVLDLDPSYGQGRGYHLRGYALARAGDVAHGLEDAERACQLGYKEGCAAAERLRTTVR